MTRFSVLGSIGADLFYIAPQGIEPRGKHIVIAHRFQTNFGCSDGMSLLIYGQLYLAPDTALLLAVLANFPLAIAIDLESGCIDDEVRHRVMARYAVLDFNRLGSLADTAVVRRTFISSDSELMKLSMARSGSLNTALNIRAVSMKESL